MCRSDKLSFGTFQVPFLLQEFEVIARDQSAGLPHQKSFGSFTYIGIYTRTQPSCDVHTFPHGTLHQAQTFIRKLALLKPLC